MKFTLSWLKTYLDTQASLQEITNTLTQIGLEVEAITDPKEQLKGFVTGHVIETSKHPDADKLTLCKVEIGKDRLMDVICGAPNARKDLKVIFATEGAIVPTNGMVIKKGKIRGVSSEGMMCSGDELGISEESDGIIELPKDTPIGLEAVDVLGLDDPVIEIALTPNRGDCAGIRGIARDLAAANLGILKPISSTKNTAPSTPIITLDIQDTEGCFAFGLYEIKNVVNQPSIGELHKQLKAIEQKTISTLVDITNFFTIDRARPLHIFDADKTRGNLVVRKAHAGEKFITLDKNEIMLTGIETIIADDSGPISLGGIIGGLSTSVDEHTTNILLECALFDPIKVANTGRLHQIDTDARYRFERQVDPQMLEPGIDDAAQMILNLCGGKIISKTIYGTIPERNLILDHDPKSFKKLMGYDVPVTQQKEILTQLGFEIKDNFKVCVPSWRPDIESQNCLIEEIARIDGYAHIPNQSLNISTKHLEPILSLRQKQIQNLRHALCEKEYMEAITWSFMSDKIAQEFGFEIDSSLIIKNPINANWNYMRPTILPNLLEAAQNNTSRTITDFSFFEIGPIFESIQPDGQKQMIAGIRVGDAIPQNWSRNTQAFDVFDIKKDLWLCLKYFGLNGNKLRLDQENIPAYYHPGRSAKLYLGKMHVATLGEIHPQLIAHYDLPKNTCAFELFIDQLPPAKIKKTTTKPAVTYSQYQPVFRDFAFVLNKKIPAHDLIRLIESVDKKLVRNVSIFDVYQGKHIDEGEKSIALRVTLQSNTQTLDEEIINMLSDKLITLIQNKLNGKLRAA